MSTLLIEAVNFGGDIETVGSLVLALSGLSTNYFINDLPEWLSLDLENGEFGMNYIKKPDKTDHV